MNLRIINIFSLFCTYVDIYIILALHIIYIASLLFLFNITRALLIDKKCNDAYRLNGETNWRNALTKSYMRKYQI